MQFDIATVQAVLKLIPPAAARAREFQELFSQIKGTFREKDQAKLQASYAALVAENDEGHQRLQDKLREAAKR